MPYAELAVELIHFERWLSLFNETIDTHFTGENAEKAKLQGNRMAQMFHSKIQYYKNKQVTVLK